MVRWLDSIPALLKEGGFLVLDDRETTNDASNPDRLKVMVSNGTGSYTLHEDLDGERIETHFQSLAPDDHTQKLTVSCESKTAVPARSLLVEFCNITSGTVRITSQGREYPAAVDDNEKAHRSP